MIWLRSIKKRCWCFTNYTLGNDILADLAKKAIEKRVRKDDATDFLTVSFFYRLCWSYFWPRSIELQDTYLRLDQNIDQFLNYLDKTVGKDNYLVFLTADHAGAENPNYLKDNKYNVKMSLLKVLWNL
jgi:hypothetical protein